MVNSDVFGQIRQGHADWLRGDIIRITENGVLFNRRGKGVPRGGPGQEMMVEADMIIMATGYHRPSIGFLPPEVFEDPYQPPAWYLQVGTPNRRSWLTPQVFPPAHVDICANNCTYANAIGTVGVGLWLSSAQADFSTVMAYRHIHSFAPRLPDRSAGSSPGILDEEMD